MDPSKIPRPRHNAAPVPSAPPILPAHVLPPSWVVGTLKHTGCGPPHQQSGELSTLRWSSWDHYLERTTLMCLLPQPPQLKTSNSRTMMAPKTSRVSLSQPRPSASLFVPVLAKPSLISRPDFYDDTCGLPLLTPPPKAHQKLRQVGVRSFCCGGVLEEDDDESRTPKEICEPLCIDHLSRDKNSEQLKILAKLDKFPREQLKESTTTTTHTQARPPSLNLASIAPRYVRVQRSRFLVRAFTSPDSYS